MVRMRGLGLSGALSPPHRNLRTSFWPLMGTKTYQPHSPWAGALCRQQPRPRALHHQQGGHDGYNRGSLGALKKLLPGCHLPRKVRILLISQPSRCALPTSTAPNNRHLARQGNTSYRHRLFRGPIQATRPLTHTIPMTMGTNAGVRDACSPAN